VYGCILHCCSNSPWHTWWTVWLCAVVCHDSVDITKTALAIRILSLPINTSHAKYCIQLEAASWPLGISWAVHEIDSNCQPASGVTHYPPVWRRMLSKRHLRSGEVASRAENRGLLRGAFEAFSDVPPAASPLLKFLRLSESRCGRTARG